MSIACYNFKLPLLGLVGPHAARDEILALARDLNSGSYGYEHGSFIDPELVHRSEQDRDADSLITSALASLSRLCRLCEPRLLEPAAGLHSDLDPIEQPSLHDGVATAHPFESKDGPARIHPDASPGKKVRPAGTDLDQ
jgi:hypothetical protein